MKCSRKDFREIVSSSRNWTDAHQQLRDTYGIFDKRSIRKRAKRLDVKPLTTKKLSQVKDIPLPALQDGYHVKGTSTLVGPDGETKNQWIKTDKDKEDQLRLLKEFAAGLAEDLRGSSIVSNPPKTSIDCLMANYIEPESHFGMYSWAGETREDYDLNIADDLLRRGAGRLIAAAPPARYALLSGIGDGLHADNQNNETTSGNKLDTDTRWGKVIKKYASFYRWFIEQLAVKHEHVMVKRVKGNHDDHSATAINLMLSFMFENNPRVIIDTGETIIKYHVFGKCLIGITHGDKSKPAALPLLMATDMPKEWGAAEFRYFQTGHIHHLTKKEHPGCVVESFRSIAAKDSWHAGQGYRAGRDMQMIVMHKDFGEVERHTVNLAQLV